MSSKPFAEVALPARYLNLFPLPHRPLTRCDTIKTANNYSLGVNDMRQNDGAKELVLQGLKFSSSVTAIGSTAHDMARVLGYSPQHINRCLKQLFSEGKVAYAELPHQGRAGFKRSWVSISKAKKSPGRYVMPKYIQMEMRI